MRNTLIAGTLGLGLCLSACGDNSSKEKAPEQVTEQPEAKEAVTPEQAAELDERFTDVPQMAIVRVALDANGNPDPSIEPELRTADTSVSNDGMAAEAFQNGSAPDVMISSEAELDADSSTQSWFRWGRGCFTSYRAGCYTNYYRPRVYHRGYSFRYNYRGFYRRGGFGYYCYNRYRYW